MTFEEAQRQFEELKQLLRQQRITATQFQSSLNSLRVQDASGRWWQPNPAGEGWLCWDGNAWQPAVPPSVNALPRPPAATPSGASAQAVLQPLAERGFAALSGRGAGQFMDPQFFLQIAKTIPLRQRPQAWWNLLSVLGGAISGYFWFVYGSVRGMPHLNITMLQRESWFDFLPALILAALPIVVVICRQALARRMSSLFTRIGGMSLQVKLAIAAIVLIVIAVFTTNNYFFVQREGLDIFTPILMSGIPLMLVWFRPDVDKILMPIQDLRKSIPRPVLVGIGLAMPILIAFVLYSFGLRMYPLLRANVFIGTLVSYALLREPNLPASGQWKMPHIPTVLFVIAGFLFFVLPGFADDFLRDPFNLNDGLRTDGIAPILSGVATAVVSMLINGVEVARVVIQGAEAKEGEKAEHKNFQVVVKTLDELDQTSTTIKIETGGIFIYGHCEEAGRPFPAGDGTITFMLMDVGPWVTLTDLGTKDQQRCAHVALADPLPDSGSPPVSCTVQVSAGSDGLIGYPIQLAVEVTDLDLEFF